MIREGIKYWNFRQIIVGTKLLMGLGRVSALRAPVFF